MTVDRHLNVLFLIELHAGRRLRPHRRADSFEYIDWSYVSSKSRLVNRDTRPIKHTVFSPLLCVLPQNLIVSLPQLVVLTSEVPTLVHALHSQLVGRADFGMSVLRALF